MKKIIYVTGSFLVLVFLSIFIYTFQQGKIDKNEIDEIDNIDKIKIEFKIYDDMWNISHCIYVLNDRMIISSDNNLNLDLKWHAEYFFLLKEKEMLFTKKISKDEKKEMFDLVDKIYLRKKSDPIGIDGGWIELIINDQKFYRGGYNRLGALPVDIRNLFYYLIKDSSVPFGIYRRNLSLGGWIEY